MEELDVGRTGRISYTEFLAGVGKPAGRRIARAIVARHTIRANFLGWLRDSLLVTRSQSQTNVAGSVASCTLTVQPKHCDLSNAKKHLSERPTTRPFP